MSAWSNYRRKALAEDPHCRRCGVEHGSDVGSYLHWHHLDPRHTGSRDHSKGILLCQRCHQAEHVRHKQVRIDGSSQRGLPLPERDNVKRRKTRARRISDAWSS